jgi:signal transduction histidine kinase
VADALEPGRTEALRDVIHEGQDLIAESMEGVDRTAAFVRDVKGFSHAGAGGRELEDPNRLIEAVIRVAAAQNRKGGRIVTDLGDVPLVWCARQELKQVFLNLLINAIQAIDEGGSIEVRTRADGDGVAITVGDDGPGIDPQHWDRIYDPFFTTKPVGEGTGLGLAISREIVRRHGGSIDVDSVPGTGTWFRVRIPVGSPEDDGED